MKIQAIKNALAWITMKVMYTAGLTPTGANWSMFKPSDIELPTIAPRLLSVHWMLMYCDVVS